MPKISIREIDNTGSEQREYQDYAVLIPAIKIECDLSEEVGGCKGTLDGLYESFEDFQKALDVVIAHQTLESGESGTPTLPANFAKDIGFITACECLNFGLAVQYWGAYDTVGDDGYSGDDETERDFSGEYNEFVDKGKYDLRFITTGGFKSDEAKIAALDCAAVRGDAKALIDVNEDFEPEEGSFTDGNSGEFTKAIESWIREAGIQAACGDTQLRQGTSGSSWSVKETKGRYGKLFAPRVFAQGIKKCVIQAVEDGKGNITFKSRFKLPGKGESQYTQIPASLDYLANFGYHVISKANKVNPWWAIAGTTRGKGAYKLSLPTVEFGDADIDKLQVREGDDNEGHIATNVICNIRPYGYCLWGERSMQPLSVPESDPTAAVQLTAASFSSIRELCSSIKKTLYRAGRKYTFEPNSDQLWFNFRSQITPLLEKMKGDQGIRGYEIVKQATNKKALIVAVVKISPIEPVEDFDLTVEMSDTIDSVTE